MGNAGTVFVPAGQYYIASSIRMTQIKGVMLQGGGSDNNTAASATQIISLPTLAGLPELFLWNCYSSGAKDLSIYGSITAPPIAGVESRSANPGGGLPPHRLMLSNLYINGRPPGTGITTFGTYYGVAWTADPAFDANNDQGEIDNVNLSNLSVAGYYTGHNNAQAEHIVGGLIEFMPVAYLSNSGNITMTGTSIDAISDTAIWRRAGDESFTGATQIVNVQNESLNGQILRIDSNSLSPRVSFVNYYHYSSSTKATNIIDVQGTYAAVSFVSCDINRFGNPNWTAQFTDSYSSAQFIGGIIGLKTINYAGTLIAYGVAASDTGFTSGLTALNSTASANIGGLSIRLLTAGTDALVSFKSPEVLLAFGTCSGSSEGRVEIETNSTAACSAGTVATNGGTTHCQIYCNGSNWIQTGR